MELSFKGEFILKSYLRKVKYSADNLWESPRDASYQRIKSSVSINPKLPVPTSVVNHLVASSHG